jgi:hypothetical protein
MRLADKQSTCKLSLQFYCQMVPQIGTCMWQMREGCVRYFLTHFRTGATSEGDAQIRRNSWQLLSKCRITERQATRPLPFSYSCPKNRTGESALLNVAGELCGVFLWRALKQSGFHEPVRECNAITNRSYGESDLTFLPCNDCGNQRCGGMSVRTAGRYFLGKTRQVNPLRFGPRSTSALCCACDRRRNK